MRFIATNLIRGCVVASAIALFGCATPNTQGSWEGNSQGDRTGEIARQLAEQISREPASGAPIKRIVILPLKISREAAHGYWFELEATRRDVAEMLKDTLPDSIRTEVFRLGKYEIVADRDMNRAIQQLHIENKLYSEGLYLDSQELTDLGSMLNAQAILDGKITRSDNNLRVALEMIDIRTGRVVAVAQSLYR